MRAALWAHAGCLVAVLLSLAFAPAAGAAPLRLDARFGDGGIVRVPLKLWNPGGGLTGALRPVRQPDGKVLVPAKVERYAGSYSFEQVALARFKRRGAVGQDVRAPRTRPDRLSLGRLAGQLLAGHSVGTGRWAHPLGRPRVRVARGPRSASDREAVAERGS